MLLNIFDTELLHSDLVEASGLNLAIFDMIEENKFVENLRKSLRSQLNGSTVLET